MLLVLPLIVLLHDCLPCLSSPCVLSDPRRHICLHTFLERDLPLVEEMVFKPGFIREGREFEEMCL